MIVVKLNGAFSMDVLIKMCLILKLFIHSTDTSKGVIIIDIEADNTKADVMNFLHANGYPNAQEILAE